VEVNPGYVFMYLGFSSVLLSAFQHFVICINIKKPSVVWT